MTPIQLFKRFINQCPDQYVLQRSAICRNALCFVATVETITHVRNADLGRAATLAGNYMAEIFRKPVEQCLTIKLVVILRDCVECINHFT